MNTNKTLSMDSGNFSLSFGIELRQEVLDDLIQKGLKYEIERGVLSKVYLALAGIAGKRAGAKVLPKGYKRESLAYTEENAARFEGALTEAMKGLGNVSSLVITKWEAATADTKYAAEREAMARHESANDLEIWLEGKIGFKGETHGDDGEYSIQALAAIREYVDALRKSL